MAGRFPLYTDADVRGPLIRALTQAGWDVVRAIDAFPQGTSDDVHFEYASKAGRVLVSHDKGVWRMAALWVRDQHAFTGLVACPQESYDQMTLGALVAWFERRAQEDDPFAYPIRYVSPGD